MKLEFFQQIFERYSNIKYNKNPSSGSRIVPCGQTDITKLTVAFRNSANASKSHRTLWWMLYVGYEIHYLVRRSFRFDPHGWPAAMKSGGAASSRSTFCAAKLLTQLAEHLHWSWCKSCTSLQLSKLVNVGNPIGVHKNSGWDHRRERWQTGSGYNTKSGNRPTQVLNVRISLQPWIYVRIILLSVSLCRHSPCHGQISRPWIHKKGLQDS
jgi:hypothetical protein